MLLLCGRLEKASFPSGVSRNWDDVISLIVLRRPARNSFTMVDDSVETSEPAIKSGFRVFVPRYAVGHVGEESDDEFSFVAMKEALCLELILWSRRRLNWSRSTSVPLLSTR